MVWIEFDSYGPCTRWQACPIVETYGGEAEVLLEDEVWVNLYLRVEATRRTQGKVGDAGRQPRRTIVSANDIGPLAGYARNLPVRLSRLR